MIDACGRNIRYLRLSVTEKCNLNCLYCSPAGKNPDSIQCKSLTIRDYELIIGIMADLGITKVRITGGEPLVRPDICQIVSVVSNNPLITDISITTNGINLAPLARNLKEAGLHRLNISLDSLERDKFKKITGSDRLNRVFAGIEKALEAGLTPIKTNTVLIRGMNDMEIDDFIALTKEYPIDVRFIELMPIGKFGEANRDKVVDNSQIIASHPELIPCESDGMGQPAQYFRVSGYKGRVGFISPISHQFCNECNRIRLTCDGKLKPCLGNNSETDITEYLGSPAALREAIQKAVYEKPKGHNFIEGFSSDRDMSAIGG